MGLDMYFSKHLKLQSGAEYDAGVLMYDWEHEVYFKDNYIFDKYLRENMKNTDSNGHKDGPYIIDYNKLIKFIELCNKADIMARHQENDRCKDFLPIPKGYEYPYYDNCYGSKYQEDVIESARAARFILQYTNDPDVVIYYTPSR